MDIDFLVLEGNIGAGKTTLTKMLSEELNSKLILEESTFAQQNDFPVLVIDTSNIDFVENPTDYKRIKEVIFKSKFPNGLNRVIL